jgi:hypothetical protein
MGESRCSTATRSSPSTPWWHPARRRWSTIITAAPAPTGPCANCVRSPRPRRRSAPWAPAAEAFLRAAAAAGVARIGAELEDLAGLEAAHGREALIATLERAVAFGRWARQRRPVDPGRRDGDTKADRPRRGAGHPPTPRAH